MLSVWHQTALISAIFVGMVFGSVAIARACWVWVKKQAFGYSGSVLCMSGVLLIGFSLWQSIDLGVDKNGVSLKVQAFIDQADKSADEAKIAADKATTAANTGNTAEALKAASDAAHAANASATAAKCAAVFATGHLGSGLSVQAEAAFAECVRVAQ